MSIVIAAARWPWFEVDVRGDAVILSGELDLASARTLDDVGPLVRHLLPSPRAVLDLGGLTFLDTAGLDALRRLQVCLEAEGVTVAAGPRSPAVERLLSLLAPQGEPRSPRRAVPPARVRPR